MTTLTVPVEQLMPNPHQPRKHFSEDELRSLAQSIKANGIIQPVVVERISEEQYIIHDGERRVRAAKLLGLYAVPAFVVEGDSEHTDEQRLIRALVANVQRADLNPIEEANAYQKMRDMGMTYARITEMTGVNPNTIKSRLELLNLDKPIQKLIAAEQLPRDVRVAKALQSIPDAEPRIKLAQRLARPGITINAAVNACNRLVERMREAEQIKSESTPAVALLPKRPKPEETEQWRNVRAAAQGMCDACDANPHLGNVPEPAWTLILEAAHQTCDKCNLRSAANLAICKECPGVELLRRMAGAHNA